MKNLDERSKPLVRIAGAVVYRMNGETIEFLVQKSRKNPAILLFPKGHVDLGESVSEAALRELKEESGVIGQNIGFLHEFTREYEDEIQQLTFFLFRFSGIGGEPEKGRDPRWLDAPSAIISLSDQEYSKMIKMAIERLAPQVTFET